MKKSKMLYRIVWKIDRSHVPVKGLLTYRMAQQALTNFLTFHHIKKEDQKEYEIEEYQEKTS